MVFNAHVFDEEQAAIDAVETINAGEGYPIPGGLTTSYCTYYPVATGFYIIADDITRKYIKNNEQELKHERQD